MAQIHYRLQATTQDKTLTIVGNDEAVEISYAINPEGLLVLEIQKDATAGAVRVAFEVITIWPGATN